MYCVWKLNYTVWLAADCLKTRLYSITKLLSESATEHIHGQQINSPFFIRHCGSVVIYHFQFHSQCYFISCWLFFHMLHFPHLYLFPVSSVFSNVPDFYMCSRSPFHMFSLSFHMLWLCSRPFPSYYDILYFYVLSSLRSRFIPTQYINRCISVVVLQFVNWRWFFSSPILPLSSLYPFKVLSTLSSLSLSSGNHITTKMNLRPSDLTSRLVTKF